MGSFERESFESERPSGRNHAKIFGIGQSTDAASVVSRPVGGASGLHAGSMSFTNPAQTFFRSGGSSARCSMRSALCTDAENEATKQMVVGTTTVAAASAKQQ